MVKTAFLIATLCRPLFAQTIYDTFTTTWDRSSLFTYKNLGKNHINFGSSFHTEQAVLSGNHSQHGLNAAQATITVDQTQVYQTMDGFGACLTDSSAELLYNLKVANSPAYWSLLDYMFNITDGARTAGFSSLRVPIGATDFSAKAYSWDDTPGDTNLYDFGTSKVPSYVWNVLGDIQGIQAGIKLYVLPWSPPGWMKSSGSMDGGSLQSQYFTTFANYLVKAVEAFQSEGYTVYALSLQNEPLNQDKTYPTAYLTAANAATIGRMVRGLLNSNGFTAVKLIGYEHNWDDTTYPETVLSSAGSSYAGASFHCYAGDVSAMSTVHNAYPNSEIHLTECSGTMGTDWWSDIKWDMSNLVIGGANNYARTVLTWALALDGNGNPKLPGTDSCGGPGCRGVVTISNNQWSVNQEFYSLAHGSRAILPRDVGGPWAQRIGSHVSGSLGYELVVTAYRTARAADSPSNWPRYSIVVLNWDDTNSNGNWDPVPVSATITFNGLSAAYTFPVGVTTLWWYWSS